MVVSNPWGYPTLQSSTGSPALDSPGKPIGKTWEIPWETPTSYERLPIAHIYIYTYIGNKDTPSSKSLPPNHITTR